MEFEQIGGPIDDHPAINGLTSSNKGKRIYPDQETAGDTGTDKRQIRIKVTVTPAIQGVNIYFKSYDMDDPSSNSAPLDTNGSVGNDNKGNVNNKKEGEISASPVATNTSGVASHVLTVTKNPGDNFAVVVAKKATDISNLVVDGVELKRYGQAVPVYKASSPPSPTSTANPVMRTELLTVWRRLHIEHDSMSAVSNNKITGTFPASMTYPANTYPAVQVSPSLEPNRFELGRLETGGQSFEIYENSTNTVSITVPAQLTITQGQTFTIYDDDDFNSNDGTTQRPKHGDEGEDIPLLSQDFLKDSDTPTTSINTPDSNVLAAAYIRPKYDLPGSGDETTFYANIPANTTQAAQSTFQFNNSATEASVDFWTVYLLSGYQFTTGNDGDPQTETAANLLRLGISDSQNGQGSIVFLEVHTSHECVGTVIACSISATKVHEIGHLLNANHNQGGVMDEADIKFSDTSLNFIRSIAHP